VSYYDWHEHYEVVTNGKARKTKEIPVFEFLPGHTQCRDTHGVRRRLHPKVPMVYGPSIPTSSTERAKLAKIILAMHKPFRKGEDLRPDGMSWTDALDAFTMDCLPRTRRLIQNLEGFACASTAHQKDLRERLSKDDDDLDDDILYAGRDPESM